MIPQFPKFKKLELEDKIEFEEFVREYHSYSDYNFVSLYSYNTEDLIEISLLNGNLAVMFTDYITNKPFYSFIGNNNVKNTIDALIEFSVSQGRPDELGLIPEINIKTNEDLSEFDIKEDPDNFDYILSSEEIKTLAGNKYRGKRNFVNRFVREYGKRETEILDLTSVSVQKEIEKLFFLWEDINGKTREETKTELKALQRLLKASSSFDFISIGIYLDNKLIAFSIDEKTQGNYAIIHFEKADTNYTGIFQYLKQQTALKASSLGLEYINYEQDLGLPGLRKAKQSWMPVFYLKKHKVSRKR